MFPIHFFLLLSYHIGTIGNLYIRCQCSYFTGELVALNSTGIGTIEKNAVMAAC